MRASPRIAGLVGLFLLVAVPASAQLVISEFRVRGPNGANDEYIEIMNNTASDHTVAGGGTGYALAASNGVARCVIPNGTVIPARGRYLCVNSVGYSLASYPAGNGTTATGDATFTTDIPDNAGIALFSTSIAVNFALATRFDAVGSTSEANTLYKEGTGYPALTPFSIDYAFARDQCGKGGSITTFGPCPSGGAVLDSNNNAADFVFVDTNGTSAGAGQRLGSPGPQNLSSPLTGTASMPDALLDPCVAVQSPPNRVRDFTSDPPNNSTFGTLDLRATYTNNTGGNLTRLRFRVLDLTTFPAPSGIADLRPRTSTAAVVTVDRPPCGSGTSNVTVNGTTLEQPPSQPNGGGFNSSLSVGTVTLGTPLANGASIDVRFLFGIQQTGFFKIGLLAETLPLGADTLLELSGCTDGCSADLAVTKTDGVSTAVPGGSVTYTITASNAGSSPALSATVADTFPASLTCTWTCVGAGGGTCTAAGSGNINDTVNLPVGGSVTYTASCTIAPGATGTLSNTATVAAPADVTDPSPANNSATDSDTLTPQADLAIAKTDGVATAVPGGSVTYTITASNAGPSNATNATVADTFPASLTCTWTCVGAGGGTCTAAGSGNINNTVNLPAGGSVTYTASCTVAPGATGSLSNTATVAAPAGVTDPNPANNSATDTDTLVASANLAISKIDTPDPVLAGQNVTYTITVSNGGPSAGASVTLSDPLPAGTTFVSLSAPGGWSCTTPPVGGSGAISCTIASLGVGSGVFTLTAAIAPATPGGTIVTNTATVSSSTTDPTPGNNSATATTTVTTSADLAISKIDTPDPVVAGQNVTYTITVTNSGPGPAASATLSDPLPAGTTFVSLSAPGGWSCTTPPVGGSGAISCTIASLGVGSGVFTLTAAIAPTTTGGTVVTNTATVSSSTTDPNPANNSASATTLVRTATAGCDVDGDGSHEFITGAGAGGGPHVRVFGVAGGVHELTGFFAYDPAFTGGVFVACRDLTGDGIAEFVTGAGPGGGPHVRVLSAAGGVVTELGGFFAYDPAFTGGVSVAAGDVTGDGVGELITGAGPGGGPHVRVLSFAGGLSELAGFFAYDPAFTGGVSVAVGDLTGDGIGELITGAGPGGGPHVRVLTLAGGLSEVAGFFAYDPAFTGGVTVAAGDLTGDGVAELITGAGPGGGPHVRVWSLAGGTPIEIGGFFAYDPAFTGGVSVAAGDVTGDGIAELITGAGPGGGPHVRVWSVTSSGVVEIAGFFAYDPAFLGGVHVGR
jgi:uncharacterized repeat protein (TIGR01451 family)